MMLNVKEIEYTVQNRSHMFTISVKPLRIGANFPQFSQGFSKNNFIPPDVTVRRLNRPRTEARASLVQPMAKSQFPPQFPSCRSKHLVHYYQRAYIHLGTYMMNISRSADLTLYLGPVVGYEMNCQRKALGKWHDLRTM